VNFFPADIINSFCTKNHGLVLPSPDNCAHFYQCGIYNQKTGSYLHECETFKFFSIDKKNQLSVKTQTGKICSFIKKIFEGDFQNVKKMMGSY
jgi:hypothetical protein